MVPTRKLMLGLLCFAVPGAAVAADPLDAAYQDVSALFSRSKSELKTASVPSLPAAVAPSGLPEGASPLMSAIYQAVLPVLSNGNLQGSELAALGHPMKSVFHTGPQVYPKMAQLIREAEHEVTFRTYVWVPSDGENAILGALKDLAARQRARTGPRPPVRVRFLIDAMFLASPLHPHKSRDEFRASVAALGLDPSLVDVQVESHDHLLFGLTHAKTLVVDDRLCLVTGLNIEPVDNKAFGPWNDFAFEISGPEVASALREDFSREWRSDTGRPLEAISWESRAAQVPADSVPILILTKKADGGFGDAPNPVEAGIVAAIQNARSEVHLVSPNVNARPVLDAIVAAVSRGVTVKIVTALRFNDNARALPLQGGNNETTLARLQERLPNAGDKFQWRWYSEDGKTPVQGQTAGASHEKFYWFDGQVVIVGSANLDNPSMIRSAETSLVVDSQETARTWGGAAFDPVFARSIPATP